MVYSFCLKNGNNNKYQTLSWKTEIFLKKALPRVAFLLPLVYLEEAGTGRCPLRLLWRLLQLGLRSPPSTELAEDQPSLPPRRRAHRN